MQRVEFITRGKGDEQVELAPGFAVRVLASGGQGAKGLATCKATVQPGAELPYHTHPCSEVITAAKGHADVFVEGRKYRLSGHDAIHIPAGVPHSSINPSDEVVELHTSFSSETLLRDNVDESFPVVERTATDDSCPESLVRFDNAQSYELQTDTQFRDLFARRLGSAGICGGYGRFQPGSSLPCHTHDYDESITIVEGLAVCQVAGREYELSNFDTACIPKGRPHRFINAGDVPMAMIWVYAGDEPDRELVDQGYCSGSMPLDSLT